MEVQVWEADRHIQVDDYSCGSEADFRAFWQDIRERYPGYTLDFCYHNSPVPAAWMDAIGAQMLEMCIETRLAPGRFTPVAGYALTLVTQASFSAFATLHDRANPGMYWTAQRIGRDLAPWVIYVHEADYVLMHLGRETAEIYALEAADRGIGAALISQAAAHAFRAGRTSVLRMVDEDASDELVMVRTVGFERYGRYAAYRAVT